MKNFTSSKIKYLLISLGWLAVWEAAYLCVDNKVLMAGPIETLIRLFEDMISKNFWITILSSFGHIALGFTIGFVLGIALAALSYKCKMAEYILWPLISFLKAAPVAAFVVLFLIWWHSDVLSIVICICVVTPQIYVPCLEGLSKTDRKMLEMAEVFRLSPIDRFFFIIRPALASHMIGAVKISAALAWKSGVAAEVIGTPSFSIGEGLYKAKISLDTAGVFSWTIVVILLSVLCEKILLTIIKAFFAYTPSTHGRAYNSNKESKAQGLIADNIAFSYENGKKEIIKNLSFEYHKGENYVLDSPSGAGKTTLLNVIAGLLKPTAGGLKKADMTVAYCFQEDRLCEDVSAACNVALVCDRAKAYEALYPLFEDKSLIDKKVSTLSGGERRRVSIARAVAKNADIVLFDEPYNGLDAENILRVKEYISEYCKDRIVITATHI